MLRGISPLLSPDLLATLCAMGHGDELVLGDSNFPAGNIARRLLRADGHTISALLGAILPLVPLDAYAPPLIMMQASAGDRLDDAVEADYMSIVRLHEPNAAAPLRFEKSAFTRVAPQRMRS
jgi:L-fucose mutarotase